MELSIVVPYFRQRRCLELTLRSLAGQRPDADGFDVVVVDDDSRDDVDQLVAAYRDRLDVRLVRQPVNRGRAAARNRGAEEATGERILLLDADSMADPDLVAGHARFHRTRPNDVLLGVRVEHDWRAVAGSTATAGPPTVAAYHTDLRYRWGLDPATFSDGPAPWTFAYSHNMSVPADHFHQIGGFDERFVKWGHEDIEFAYRLFVASARRPGYFHFDPTARCHHLPHFRHNATNWAEANQMLPYLVGKHRTLEVELYEEGPMGVNAALPVYLTRLQTLYGVANQVGLGETLDALRQPLPPGRLGIGIGLADRMPPADGSDVLEHRPESGAAPALIGIRLPFPDHRFADLLNFDVWRIASPEHLSKMVVDGLRVARTMYLGASREVPGGADVGLIDCPDYLCDMLSGYAEADIVHDGDHAWVVRVRRRT
ncbi:glycosyltransferase family 2 protein [Solwaraspora sp. WMMA2101]|uniref:glycosyltransferase family 2 protein n=1 Tax=Solwaraspora sp. WMMA2101 TaxID=3404124 RepID=UPI003B95CD50